MFWLMERKLTCGNSILRLVTPKTSTTVRPYRPTVKKVRAVVDPGKMPHRPGIDLGLRLGDTETECFVPKMGGGANNSAPRETKDENYEKTDNHNMTCRIMPRYPRCCVPILDCKLITKMRDS